MADDRIPIYCRSLYPLDAIPPSDLYSADDVKWEPDNPLVGYVPVCHYTCAREFLHTPINITLPVVNQRMLTHEAPVLFKAIGQIVDDNDHYLTPNPNGSGFLNRTGTRHAKASFWIEERPNLVSHISWMRVGQNLRDFAGAMTEKTRDLTQLLRNIEELEGASVKTRVQVYWEPPVPSPGNQLQTLPLVDAHDNRVNPTSLTDIPFGRAIEVVFYLKCERRRAPQRFIFTAELKELREV